MDSGRTDRFREVILLSELPDIETAALAAAIAASDSNKGLLIVRDEEQLKKIQDIDLSRLDEIKPNVISPIPLIDLSRHKPVSDGKTARRLKRKKKRKK